MTQVYDCRHIRAIALMLIVAAGCGTDRSSRIVEVEIWQIQGSDQSSPLIGQIVTTRGVVTVISRGGTRAWIQTPREHSDDDPATSDGVLIDGFHFIADEAPAVGDLIVVRGTVEEQRFRNELPRTRLVSAELVDRVSSGNQIAPTVLVDLPDESIEEAIAFWEPLEGMLVRVDNAIVVSPTSGFGEFAMVTRANAVRGSGFDPSVNQLLLRSTTPGMVDYNPERILADDDGSVRTPQVRPGDAIASAIGVVDYTFGSYKLQLRELDYTAAATPDYPVSTRGNDATFDAVITTFNVENLFDLLDDPAKDDSSSTPTPDQPETKLSKLAHAIEHELRLPDVVVLQEVENAAIAQALGDRVNASTGTRYVATSYQTSDGRGIEVAFLWDAERVELEEAYLLSGPDVESAFGYASQSPGREPLYGRIRFDGNVVHVVGNHFKSKGGDDPIFASSFDRYTEAQRKQQAVAVRRFVDDLLADDPDALVVVTGDLNDFQFGEPGEGANHPLAILEGSGSTRLTNLVAMESEAERFSFTYDGNSQVLDHMLVSPALLERTVGADFLHFNASFPAGLEDDTTTPIRSSDHDPLEGRFRWQDE